MNSRAPPAPEGTVPVISGVTRAQFLSLFAAVMLPMFLAAVDQTLLATASLAIGTEFQALDDTAWLALGYLMASAVMIPLYGRLGDRYGYRRLLLVALSVFAVGCCLGGFASSMVTVVAARVLQGLGGGGLMVLSQALIGSIVPPRERPRYQGWFAAVFMIASVAGPVIGGFIVHGVGWRWLFWGLLPIVALAAWRVSRLPQPAVHRGMTALTDGIGVAGFAVASVLTLLWVSFAGQRFAFGSATSAALAVATIACWVWLVRRELRHPAPFLPIEVLRLAGVPAIATAIVVFAASMFALVFFVPIYLQLAQGRTASHAGLQLLPLTLGMVIGSVTTSRIVARRRRAGELPRYGLALATLAVLALAVAPTAAWLLTAVMIVCGIGFGTVMPNSQLIVQTRAGRTRLGAASALIALARSAGANLGTAVFGAVVFNQLRWLTGGEPLQTWLVQHADGVGRVETAFHWSFAVLAAVLAFGAWQAAKIPVVSLDEPHETTGEEPSLHG